MPVAEQWWRWGRSNGEQHAEHPMEETEALKQFVGMRDQLQSSLGNNSDRKTLLAIDGETGAQVIL